MIELHEAGMVLARRINSFQKLATVCLAAYAEGKLDVKTMGGILGRSYRLLISQYDLFNDLMMQEMPLKLRLAI